MLFLIEETVCGHKSSVLLFIHKMVATPFLIIHINY